MIGHNLADMPPARRYFEYVVRFFVFYSILSYFLEIELTGSDHSQGFWLWNERFCALFFTAEYITRWIISDNRRHFPFKFLSVIDLIAVLPFYAGFFVPEEYLAVIRTLRILRLLKLVRYSPALLVITDSIKKVKKELYVLGYVIFILVLLSSAMIYQFEREAQPDKFAKPSDAVWWSFVTLATVGYGDLAPVTIGGRIVAVLTMTCGIGIFGVFVSLIGSAFMVKMKEEKNEEEEIARHSE